MDAEAFTLLECVLAWECEQVIDYLGDVQTAFRRLDSVSPKKAEAKISNSDNHPNRYGVTLWNLFGRWYASEPTLAESIHRVIDLAEADAFKLARRGCE